MNSIVRSLRNRADFDARSSKGEALFSIYIIDVLPINDRCKYELYVGSTWKSIEERYEEHRSGGPKSARIFRTSARAGEIRWDLMDGFPKFYTRSGVERSEGRVARWLTNKGFRVRCDKLYID